MAARRRFAVQRHTTGEGAVHFDLMIEEGEVLVTLQLAEPPEEAASGRRSFDHRLRYLEYEGELTGGRGRVALWDRGELEDVEGAPRAARYRARLAGARLQGLYLLEELPADPAGEAPPVRWRRVSA